MKMSRTYWPPTHETFKLKPVRELLDRWLLDRHVIVDPFARNATLGTLTNDIDPKTNAQYHMEARDFLDLMAFDDVMADAVILDPPYTARQLSEHYHAVRKKVTKQDTQLARILCEVKDRVPRILKPSGIVISFGYNSGGMGTTRGFKKEEIMLIYHGGGHNDLIVVVETVDFGT